MPTPIDSSLRTGWVVIATEGQSVDDRNISAKWITDMADTYDPTFYCAQLWPDHVKWGESLGYVQALKADKVDGKQTLFAILSPTRDLIYQNQRGQYKFCSIEPLDNFTGQGKSYLFAVGITDIPASTDTTTLKFSAKHPSPVVGTSQPLDLSYVTLADGLPDASKDHQGDFLSALYRELARVLPAHCTIASRMEGGTLRLEPKDMGITGMDLAWLSYTAVFSLESLPFRECRAETLLAVAASWIQENDPFRERFELPDPTYAVMPNDEHSADIKLQVQFAEPLRIVEDPHGAINWLDKTWTVAPFDVWVADEISLSVVGGTHPVQP